jgi:eukaryotic-like serine/threonine-protein kinase
MTLDRLSPIISLMIMLGIGNPYVWSLTPLTPSGTPPGIIWQNNLKTPIYNTPLVIGQTVYVGGLDSTLYALDLATGKVQWNFKTGGDIRSDVISDGQRLYLTTGDGALYCLLTDKPQLVWKSTSGKDKKYDLFSFADYFQATPVLAHGNLYFGTGDGKMHAINPQTGALIWSFPTGNVVHGKVAVGDSLVYFGSFDGFVYALDAFSGTLIWKFKSIGHRFFPAGEMQGDALYYDGIVFLAGRDYNLYALDAASGHGHWNKSFEKGWALGKPVVHDSVLYVGTSDDRIQLALDPLDGRIRWQVDAQFNIFGSVAFDDNELYFGTLNGRLKCLDINTGRLKWQIDSESYLQNRSKYLTGDDQYRPDIGTIIRQDADILKMYYDLGAIFSTPILTTEMLLVTSTDGWIRAFQK